MHLLHIVQHWLAVHTGSDRAAGPSPFYNFFSGPGSDFQELELPVVVLVAIRHLNCHNRGCWHLGRHHTRDGHRLCRRCVAKPLEELDLHAVHDDHAGGPG